MENVKGPTSTHHTKPLDKRNDDKENKLHSLKEAPKRGFIQIKESFRTLKNVNRHPTIVKGNTSVIQFNKLIILFALN